MITKHNQYRVMWLMVQFDLPTDTRKERKAATKFRKELINDGFVMFQFSSYIRHCPNLENAEVHIKRVKKILPEYGFIAILQITDKQFGKMITFHGKKEVEKPKTPQQLELF